MKSKVFVVFCLAVVIGVVYAGSTATKGTFKWRLEQLEDRVDRLTRKVAAMEEQLNPSLKVKKEGKAHRVKSPLEVGQIVYFDNNIELEITQIIDQANMITDIIIDKMCVDYLGRSLEKRVSVWVKGFDTTGLVDGKRLKIDNNVLFKVAGTKTYDTAIGGTNTVFVLEPYQL